MASGSSNLRLKLLIDTQREKVLFAEASKEVIDFLFSLLCLPLSTVITLLSEKTMAGCISNLRQSVENLNDTYMQPDVDRDVLLMPRLPLSSPQISALLPAYEGHADDSVATIEVYMCPSRCNSNVTLKNGTVCSRCGHHMSNKLNFVGSNVVEKKADLISESGFVQKVVTYMVMDDLVVQPMSTISSIALLNSLNVKEIGALQEKEVPLGMSQGIELLRASLQSKNVLTSVFLNNT